MISLKSELGMDVFVRSGPRFSQVGCVWKNVLVVRDGLQGDFEKYSVRFIASNLGQKFYNSV